MRPAATALLFLAVMPAVTGCAARQRFLDRIRAEKAIHQPAKATSPNSVANDGVVRTNLTELPAPSELPESVAKPTPSNSSTPGGAVPPGMQFLYGSGEAVALDMQAYLGLNDLIFARSNAAQIGHEERSTVLAPGATLDKPVFLPCGDKPLAVVLDVDETALLNLGFEANDAVTGAPYDAARWDRWEKTGGNAVVATPGVLGAKAVADASHVTFVFNSNRAATNAVATEQALTRAGLGPVVHGQNLWLQGDEGSASGKDARRWAIAKKYCVIAMVGDQLGDFSDLFNAAGASPAQRRALAETRSIKTMWGHGWFILPNPVYGTAVKGSVDDVFPASKRWTDPEGAK